MGWTVCRLYQRHGKLSACRWLLSARAVSQWRQFAHQITATTKFNDNARSIRVRCVSCIVSECSMCYVASFKIRKLNGINYDLCIYNSIHCGVDRAIVAAVKAPYQGYICHVLTIRWFIIRTTHRVQCERVFMPTTMNIIDPQGTFWISFRRFSHFMQGVELPDPFSTP